MRKKQLFRTEADFINWVKRMNPPLWPRLAIGIGDDAALISPPPKQELILTADMSIEDVHFRTRLHPPQAVGHRALARSLSDIAAMGGTPRYALISLALSESSSQVWLKRVYLGLFALARRFGVSVIGGDTAITKGPTMLDVIVTGEVPRRRALCRSGANVGDLIFASGRLGMAALGLRLLLSGSRIRKPLEKLALRSHLFPQPQCALGRFLSEHRLASAMMDLSDGLSIDLRRLCDASGVGAHLFADRIPTPVLPNHDDALKLALHGGEDYQLLFTVAAKNAAKISQHFAKNPLHCIGKIQTSKAINLVTSDGKTRALKPEGWDHFARLSKR